MSQVSGLGTLQILKMQSRVGSTNNWLMTSGNLCELTPIKYRALGHLPYRTVFQFQGVGIMPKAECEAVKCSLLSQSVLTATQQFEHCHPHVEEVETDAQRG